MTDNAELDEGAQIGEGDVPYYVSFESFASVQLEYLKYFVTMRIEEITKKEWKEIHGKEYLQSGDPTKGVYGVAIKWNYHNSAALISNKGDGVPRETAYKMVDELNARLVPTSMSGAELIKILKEKTND